MNTSPKEASLRELRSLFFAVRCLMRERIPGSSRDPNTWLRMETLRFIALHPGRPMGDLARYLRVAAPSASSLVQTLSRAGHIRRGGARDRRSVELFVTAQGRRELERAEKVSMRAMIEVFGKLSQKDIEILSDTLRTAASQTR